MYAVSTIPYFPPPAFELPLVGRIQAFELFAILGFLSGLWVAVRCARSLGLDPRILFDYAPWGLVSGFVCGHLFHVFVYEPFLLEQDPWFVLAFSNGQSSFGAFLGVAVAMWLFFRRRRHLFFVYADSMGVAVACGWGVARFGCFLAHDHLGRLTNFFLAVDFPDGARHDMGFYDMLLCFSVAAVAWLVFRRRPRRGTVGAMVVGGYGTVRFFLEFLRASDLERSDVRYGGLTPAQYGCFALLAFGAFLLHRSRSLPRAAETFEEPSPPS